MENTILNITLKKGVPPSKASDLFPIADEPKQFRGDENNPFLAPRGVFFIKNCLFVSDTGQNRVFIFKNVSLNLPIYQSPDVVLGQMDMADTARNSGKIASASTLQYPSGIWSDGKKLIVADAWNHRVLIWNNIPTHNGQAADVVVGQPDFEHNAPNVKGIGAAPTARSLNWCYGVFSDGQKLWIADTGNRRVLFFNHIPTENYMPADGVIGKANFEERDYDNEDAIWPYSVKISPEGKMSITDTQYYRVLLWHHWQDAFSKKADAIIGQTNFMENGQNQYCLFPKANTLNWCYDSFFYKKGIFVADTGNSRVLWFEDVPTVCDVQATNLIGKKDFNTGSENEDTLFGTDKSLYWQFSIAIDNDIIAIADTGNHRIILQNLIIDNL